MEWINSTAIAVKKGSVDMADGTIFNRVNTEGDAVGTIIVESEKISWRAGFNNGGTATCVGQAKSAVEKLSDKG
jgi:hypothetical protein